MASVAKNRTSRGHREIILLDIGAHDEVYPDVYGERRLGLTLDEHPAIVYADLHRGFAVDPIWRIP